MVVPCNSVSVGGPGVGATSARAADFRQAVYYRAVLADQRVVLAAKLAKARKMLARSLEHDDKFAIKRTQCEIRAMEASDRDLDRLISALDRRFGARRQAEAATR